MSMIDLTGRVGGNDAAVAALAKTVGLDRFPAGTPLLTFGSSTIQRAMSYNSGTNALHKSLFGDIHVLEALAMGSWTSENRPDAGNSRGFSGTNFGYSGQTSATLKDYLPAVIAHPSPVVMLAAQNDYSSTDGRRAYNQVLENLVRPLLGAGKTVLWRTNIPRGTTGALPLAIDDPTRRYLLQMNDLIRASDGLYPGLYCIDTWAALADPSLGPAMPKAGVSEDGTHLSYLGAMLSAYAMYPQVQRVFGLPSYVDAPGNLLTFNPATTGGVAGTGITGTAPNNTRITSVAGNPFTSAADADPVTAAANGSMRFIGTPTVTGSSNALNVSYTNTPATGNPNYSLAALGLAVGDTVRASAFIRVTKGIEALAGLEMRMEAQSVASGATLDTNARAVLWTSSFPSAAVFDAVLAGAPLWLQTEPLTIPAGMTHLKLINRIVPGTAGSEIDLRLFRPRLEKLAA